MSEWFEKPREKSRWDRFKDWCDDNDFWQKVGLTILSIALIGAFTALIILVCEPEPGDLIKEGVIIDMGHYVPGKNARQYGCWIKI